METKVILTTELQLKAIVADAVSAALKYYQPTSIGTIQGSEPYGDFSWLKATCAGIPESTLRIHSAAGKIPGVVKFGKRVLYEKDAVYQWLRSLSRRAEIVGDEIDQTATNQVDRQLSGRRRVAA